jgi:hypothetical protein
MPVPATSPLGVLAAVVRPPAPAAVPQALPLLEALQTWAGWELAPCRSYGGARALYDVAAAVSAAGTATLPAALLRAATVTANATTAAGMPTAAARTAATVQREALAVLAGAGPARTAVTEALCGRPEAQTPSVPAHAAASAALGGPSAFISGAVSAVPDPARLRLLLGDTPETLVSALTLPASPAAVARVAEARELVAITAALSLVDPVATALAAAAALGAETSAAPAADSSLSEAARALRSHMTPALTATVTMHGTTVTASMLTSAAALAERLAATGVALAVVAGAATGSAAAVAAAGAPGSVYSVNEAWARSAALTADAGAVDLLTPLTSTALGPYAASRGSDVLTALTTAVAAPATAPAGGVVREARAPALPRAPMQLLPPFSYSMQSLLAHGSPRGVGMPGPHHVNSLRVALRLLQLAALHGAWLAAADDEVLTRFPRDPEARAREVAAAAPTQAEASGVAAALSWSLTQWRARLAGARSALAREAAAEALRALSALRAPPALIGDSAVAGDWAAFTEGSGAKASAASLVSVVGGAPRADGTALLLAPCARTNAASPAAVGITMCLWLAEPKAGTGMSTQSAARVASLAAAAARAGEEVRALTAEEAVQLRPALAAVGGVVPPERLDAALKTAAAAAVTAAAAAVSVPVSAQDELEALLTGAGGVARAGLRAARTAVAVAATAPAVARALQAVVGTLQGSIAPELATKLRPVLRHVSHAEGYATPATRVAAFSLTAPPEGHATAAEHALGVEEAGMAVSAVVAAVSEARASAAGAAIAAAALLGGLGHPTARAWLNLAFSLTHESERLFQAYRAWKKAGPPSPGA